MKYYNRSWQADRILKATLFVALTACSAVGLAQSGGKDGGGGDIQCDALIQSDAKVIANWIKKNGPTATKLDLSSSKKPQVSPARPYSISEYEDGMKKLFILPLTASCVSDGQPGYPVKVGNDVKICTSYVDAIGFHMTCDREVFMALDDSLKIQQLHHEYAIHLLGLEPDNGSFSTYLVSQQLSGLVDHKLVPVINIRPQPAQHVRMSYSEMQSVDYALLQAQEPPVETCKTNDGTDPKTARMAGLLEMINLSCTNEMVADRIRQSGRNGYVFTRPYADGRMVVTILLSVDGQSIDYVEREEQYLTTVVIGTDLNHPTVTTAWKTKYYTICNDVNF